MDRNVFSVGEIIKSNFMQFSNIPLQCNQLVDHSKLLHGTYEAAGYPLAMK